MSYNAYAYALKERPFQATPARPVRKRSFRVELIDLVRPDSFWPQPLCIEQAFELMRWMVQTGCQDTYSTKERWGTRRVADLLGGTSGIGHTSMLPIAGLDDLRRRFHWAILGRAMSEGQARWREDHGIKVDGTITVKQPTYRPFDGASHLGWRSEADIQDAFAALCIGSTGKRMAVSLNSVHKHSVNWLHHVKIGISKDRGFAFHLAYGEKPGGPGGTCEWSETIARSRPGESFLDTMARARDVFECLVHGKSNGADTGDLFEFRYIGEDFVAGQIAALPVSAPSTETA